ncbi:MAG: hypothetical protein ACRCU5_16925, partial [Rhizobiaceae bacterium]
EKALACGHVTFFFRLATTLLPQLYPSYATKKLVAKAALDGNFQRTFSRCTPRCFVRLNLVQACPKLTSARKTQDETVGSS